MDYYAVLNIAPSASMSEIKVAYKTMAVKFHPDKNINDRDDAEIRFKMIQEAYNTLSDKTSRANYDKTYRHKQIQTDTDGYEVEIDEFGIPIHSMSIHSLASIL